MKASAKCIWGSEVVDSHIQLDVEDLVAGYGGQIIIRDVSFSLISKEVLGVIGANGSGKSTLVKALMGTCRVFSGSVILNGQHLAGEKTKNIARAGIGYVPQLENVFAGLTVRENLEMGGYIVPKDSLEQRIEEVLNVFPELRNTLKKRASDLSGGQRGMVAVGRAMMGGPQIAIFDEPTAGLAPKYRDAVWELVSRVSRAGLGVLVIEQDARRALQYTDRCLIFGEGHIADVVKSDDVKDLAEVAGFYLGT